MSTPLHTVTLSEREIRTLLCALHAERVSLAEQISAAHHKGQDATCEQAEYAEAQWLTQRLRALPVAQPCPL